MKACMVCLSVLTAGVFLAVAWPVQRAEAQLTVAQRRELSEIRKEVTRAAGQVRRKNIEEAESLIDQAEQRLNQLTQEAGLSDDDRAVAGIKRQIETQRRLIGRQQPTQGDEQGEEGRVSFAGDVAPILSRRCTDCHSNNPRGGLRLDSFAGLKKGGDSGPLLTVGNATRSRIMARLTAPPNLRMPKNRPALPREEIETIARWINQGAKFDGDDESTPVSRLRPAREKPKDIDIPRPTGDETVSFKEEIAPFMVNICMRCHSGDNPRGGFSLETFEKLMIGGDSGPVLVPGSLDESYLWDLVGKQDPIKMPPGQLLITRTNHRNLETWIKEGAAFDGEDAQAPLRDLVPTAEELRAQELAMLSSEEFAEFRVKRGQELWERVHPNVEPEQVASEEFVVLGNVPESRLQTINQWAEEHAESLRTMFDEKTDPIWKGKLTIFVMKDRFDFEEFNLVIHRRETPREIIGHSVVVPSYADAYVVLQDVGDEATSGSPDMQVNLIDHLTGAYLKRSEEKLPDWVLRGTGLALVAGADPDNSYIQGLRGKVPELLQSVKSPEDVFKDGMFSPSGVAAVGYTLVDFMLKRGGSPKFGQLVQRLQGGANLAAAMRAVYQGDPRSIATAYLSSLGGRRSSR